MSHFAKVNSDGVVEQVIVAEQDYIDTLPDKEDWVQTSYNTLGGQHLLGGTPFRKNYACIGGTYDKIRDAFIQKKPFDSWVLNEDTCMWEPPIECPDDGKDYKWDESVINWVEVIV